MNYDVNVVNKHPQIVLMKTCAERNINISVFFFLQTTKDDTNH